MSLHPSTSFRRAGFALATIAGLMAGGSAFAQTAPSPTPVNAPASQGVPAAQCAAFGKYLLEEFKAFPSKLSGAFMESASRFVGSDCAIRDAKGEIFLITMNDQDGASLRTALKRMGTYDIRTASGVRGCHRPPTAACPATTSSNFLPKSGS